MTMRVAIVGSGPSGIYAADGLLDQGFSVDVLDRLPVPFGLVRYGVAPDHVSIRSVRDTLDKVWDRPGVRFVGNVEVGRDVSVAELLAAYEAVILTYGASSDRRLGIDGEDLSGSVAATDFVAWYTGHPDYQGPDFAKILSSVRRVAVIGVGNVAVDVVRVLAKAPSELAQTDMPDDVLAALAAADIEDISLLGRRGPVQAAFTTKELRELGELLDADVDVDTAVMNLDPTSTQEVETNKVAARNLAVMREWMDREPRSDVACHIHVRFFTRPIRIDGDGRVERLVVEETSLDEGGQLVGSGIHEELPVDLVVRSVGYRGLAIPGVPFDPGSNVIPNVEGRVMQGEEVVPRLYAAGWIKRGPTGIIGTNKKCAMGTVAALLADVESGVVSKSNASGHSLDSLLTERGAQIVNVQGWRAIDAEERRRGEEQGRPRVTVSSRDELLDLGTTAQST